MKKILLVDDEKMLCFLVKKNLESTGEFVVDTVSDPRLAVETVMRTKPDLVLLDVMMPGSSGNALAAAIRERPQTKDIPIVFMTGIISSDEVRAKNNFIGNEYFVAKPVDIDDLISVIKRVCG
jgi:CheY-like chemotaxis protein